MARTGFIMSMILAFLGVILLSVGLLVQALLPKVGRMAFIMGGGSYSPTDYEPSAAALVSSRPCRRVHHSRVDAQARLLLASEPEASSLVLDGRLMKNPLVR